MLQYPNDRHNGYVLLHDGDGNLMVPEFVREKDDALAYCRAFMWFARAIDKDTDLCQPDSAAGDSLITSA